jgi:hypothetical protein
MNHKPIHRSVFILLAVLLALAMAAGTLAFAQSQGRAITDVTDEAELEALEALDSMQMPVSYIDGVTPGLPPDENPLVEGATISPEATNATFKYFMVSGATLRGRSSTATYTYSGFGCIYSTDTDTADRLVNTELHIPDNATIKYLRIYYIDTSTTARPSGYITYYAPGSSTTDLITISDTAMDLWAGGYGFTVSTEVTHTVNNVSQAYTLIGWPSAGVDTIQICGMRVAYYEPVVFRVSLPIIRK